MNNKIAILLNGPISNDSRMIKITRTISSFIDVDLFYIDGKALDKEIFGKNVNLISLASPSGFINKIVRHSAFYNEFNFFVPKVLAQKTQYKYVYACDLPMLKPAYLIKEKLSSKLIYDSHELYVEGLNQFFPNYKNTSFPKKALVDISLSIMTNWGRKVENELVQKTDFFITTSNSYKNYFETKYGKKGILKVMNCPPLEERKILIDYREKYNWSKDDFIVIYQGLMNPGRALHLLIDAIKKAPENIKLIFLGYGTLEKNLKEQTEKLGLSHRIIFMDKVSSKDLVGYSMAADLGVNLLENINLNKKLASTNKLFEYIHASIPVLATDTPENQYVLNKYNIGFLAENDVENLTNQLIEASTADLMKLKSNCKEASKEFNWENQVKAFEQIFNTVSK